MEFMDIPESESVEGEGVTGMKLFFSEESEERSFGLWFGGDPACLHEGCVERVTMSKS